MGTIRSAALGTAFLITVGTAAYPAWADGTRGYDRPSIWRGLYAGVHAGYGEAGDASGFVGGGQIGYNWQSQQLVYGLEADISLSDISAEGSASVPGLVTVSGSASIDFMATVRGRLGVLIEPRLLVYGTVGVAFASGETRLQANVPVMPQLSGSASTSESATGLAYGIGVEGKLSDTMSARIEYLALTNFDDFNDDGIGIIRAGLNFKLGQ